MANLEITLLALMLFGVALGGWSLCWARFSQESSRARWGQRLCVLTLLHLGGCALVAACWRSSALAPLGLSAGLLVVAMLWESPLGHGTLPEPLSRPEEA